jgi:glycosyltransferase involved in cell wall biosynthesis
LHHFLARKAVTTIVTNEHFQQMIHGWGGHAFVLRDIPTTFSSASPRPTNGAFTVVVVNSYAADEPLEEVLDAAADIDGVQFYVTGKKSRGARRLPATLPDNVHLTGFLPEDDYYALLDGSQAVMCLTTRDHTMQRGACEALSLGKPIITSDWPILQNYFRKGTVHVDNTAGGIRQGIVQMQMNYKDYQAGIKELQREQQEEWRTRISLLTTLIEESLAAKSKL